MLLECPDSLTAIHDFPDSPAPIPDLNDWFAEEVHPLLPALRGYLAGRFASITDPEDIVQDALLKLTRVKLRGRVDNPKALLFMIARNDAISLIRRRIRSPWVDISPDRAWAIEADEPGVHDRLIRQQEIELLRAAVDALPPRCRQVMRLRCFEGLTLRGIADELGMSPSSVENHLQKGIRNCAAYVAQFRDYGRDLYPAAAPACP